MTDRTDWNTKRSSTGVWYFFINYSAQFHVEEKEKYADNTIFKFKFWITSIKDGDFCFYLCSVFYKPWGVLNGVYRDVNFWFSENTQKWNEMILIYCKFLCNIFNTFIPIVLKILSTKKSWGNFNDLLQIKLLNIFKKKYLSK